jgi:hypothetical protein
MRYRVVTALAAAGLLGSMVVVPASGTAVVVAAPASVPSAVEVTPSVENDTSPALSDIAPLGPTPKSRANKSSKPRIPLSRLAAMRPDTQGSPDVESSGGEPVSAAGSPSMPAATSFAGMTNPNGYYPPDTVGEIGPNHYVQMVNAAFTVFDRSGTPLYGPADFNTVFFGFGGACQSRNDGDPIVLYDQLADRWILSQFALPADGDQLECVAVSATADPLGPYHRYAFSYGALMPDYPKLGVWPDGYYATYNLFDPANGWAYAGAKVCALERRAMLVGAEASQQCFDLPEEFSLLPADVDGPTPPPDGSPAYLLGEHWSDANKVTLHRFYTDWDDPSLTRLEGPVYIGVDPFTWACYTLGGYCVPQPPVTDVTTPAPLAITTTALPDAVAGAAYSTALSARGGTAPYTWTVAPASLPDGWELSPTGVLTITTPVEGTSDPFEVTLTDSSASPRTATAAFTVTTVAAPALSITTSSVLPDGMAGTEDLYEVTLTAAGGTAPYSWEVIGGGLPAYLVLDSETGLLTGTLFEEGSSTFTVQVTDSTAGTPLTDTTTLTLKATPPIDAPLLDSLGGRMMYRLAYRNFGDHESLVTSHTVAMDGDPGLTRQTGTGWYEFRSPRKDPYRYQEGTVANADGTTFQWMASTAMDQQGNIALGYSSSSTALYPSINYVGRLAEDPLGAMPYAEGTIVTGGGSQWGVAARWGDYSAMTVDPLDDCTFWYTNQYLTAASRTGWTTRVASFRFPGCTGTTTTPGAPAPAKAVAGNASATITWAQPDQTGGMPITGYSVTANPGGAGCSTLVGVDANPLTCAVQGLSNGTSYTFSVTATNAKGVGAPALTGAVTPSAGSSGGGGGSGSEPTPTPSPSATKPPPGPGPNPGPPVLTPTDDLVPSLQVVRQRVGTGERVRVRALHVTPGCRVTFTLKKSTAWSTANATGVAAVTLRTPDNPGRYRVRAVQSGTSCPSLRLAAPLRVTR